MLGQIVNLDGIPNAKYVQVLKMYQIVLFGPNYSNNSNSEQILIVSIENLVQYRIYWGFENGPNTNIKYHYLYLVLTIQIVRIIQPNTGSRIMIMRRRTRRRQ